MSSASRASERLRARGVASPRAGAASPQPAHSPRRGSVQRLLHRVCPLAKAEEALQRSGELTIKTAKGHPRVNPLVRIASQAMDDMRRIGAEFGLSPNARLRLSGIKPPTPPSKFEGLPK